MDRQTRQARALAAPARARILDRLHAGGPAAAVDLAALVGLHLNTTRHHLDTLHRAGLVERSAETPTRPGRPRVLYRARADASGVAGYRELANALADEMIEAAVDPSLAAVNAGLRWARREEPARAGELPPPSAEEALARLLSLLDRLGFAPRTPAAHDRIYLGACPFAGSARHNPRMICGVHLGLLRGVLERMAAPLTVTAVRPLDTGAVPTGTSPCVAFLATTDRGGPR